MPIIYMGENKQLEFSSYLSNLMSYSFGN